MGECHADGSLVITKPAGTGGLVSVGTVAEQLLYEVSDPADYIVTDVRCDFSQVTLEQIGPDRVRVSGARGRAPTDTYKVCLTYEDGWRAIAYQPLIGEEAGGQELNGRPRRCSRARGCCCAHGDLRISPPPRASSSAPSAASGRTRSRAGGAR